MMRRLGKRILSFFLAVWLVGLLAMDGQVKAAIVIKNTGHAVAPLFTATVSGGDSLSDNTVQHNNYQALDSLEKVEAADEEIIFYRDNGLNIVWSISKYAGTTAGSKGAGKVGSALANKLNYKGIQLLKNSQKLTQSAANMQNDIAGLTSKLGTPGSKGAKARLEKTLASQAKKESAAVTKAAQGNLCKIGGKVLSAVSIGFDVKSICEDYKSLGNLKNEHASLRAVEGSLYAADMAFSAASITLAGVVLFGGAVSAPVTAVVAVGGVIVGVASAIVGSEGFANLMNNTDNAFLRSFDNMVSSLFQNIKTALGIGCYKPNIYIYGADGQLVRVIFGAPGLVVISDPYYDPAVGWSVIAENDGTLWDDSGESYEYLFYESVTERDMFNTEEGFYISADRRSEDFRTILSEYGFNQAEVDDFVEFWDEKLEKGKEYLMYPQYTATVDSAMPITITPAPDNICRIWFVFEEYKQQDYKEEQIIPFARDGYSVVEWGGMIF